MFTSSLLAESIPAFLCLLVFPLLFFTLICALFFKSDSDIAEKKRPKTLFFMMFVSCYIGVGCWSAYKVWEKLDWLGVLSMFLPTFWHIVGALVLAFLYHFPEKHKLHL